MKKLILGVAVLSFGGMMAQPASAREETRVIGYVKTETVVSTRDAEFARVDKNKDGVISFKEFADATVMENEYMMFKMNDTNNDGVLDITEFRNFSKQGPARVKKSFSRSGTNNNLSETPIH